MSLVSEPMPFGCPPHGSQTWGELSAWVDWQLCWCWLVSIFGSTDLVRLFGIAAEQETAAADFVRDDINLCHERPGDVWGLDVM